MSNMSVDTGSSNISDWHMRGWRRHGSRDTLRLLSTDREQLKGRRCASEARRSAGGELLSLVPGGMSSWPVTTTRSSTQSSGTRAPGQTTQSRSVAEGDTCARGVDDVALGIARQRPARPSIVLHRAHVVERRVEHDATDRAWHRRDQARVYLGHALGWRVVRQSGEHLAPHQLNAGKVHARHRTRTRDEAGHCTGRQEPGLGSRVPGTGVGTPAFRTDRSRARSEVEGASRPYRQRRRFIDVHVEYDAAVAAGFRMRHEAERDQRPARVVRLPELAHREVAERVAVDDQQQTRLPPAAARGAAPRRTRAPGAVPTSSAPAGRTAIRRRPLA